MAVLRLLSNKTVRVVWEYDIQKVDLNKNYNSFGRWKLLLASKDFPECQLYSSFLLN